MMKASYERERVWFVILIQAYRIRISNVINRLARPSLLEIILTDYVFYDQN